MSRNWVKNKYFENQKCKPLFEPIIFISGMLMFFSFIFHIYIYSAHEIDEMNAEGVSMQPTFETEVNLRVNKSDLALNSLTYHDIIVFKSKTGKGYVKRIIGMPGDTVEIKDKMLYINGEYIEEDFIIPDTSDVPNGPIKLGENEYFVMGDNRANSTDSRSVSIGAVHKDTIVARVFGGESQLSPETYDFIRYY